MKQVIYFLMLIICVVSCGSNNHLEYANEKPPYDSVLIDLFSQYIEAHHEFNSFVIMSNHVLKFDEQFCRKEIYVIGPAYERLFGTGEFEFDMPVPTNYMRIDNHIIFLKKASEPIQNEKTTSFYARNSVPLKNVGKDGKPYLQPASEMYIDKSLAIWKDSTNNEYVVSNRVDTLLVKFSEVKILPVTHE